MPSWANIRSAAFFSACPDGTITNRTPNLRIWANVGRRSSCKYSTLLFVWSWWRCYPGAPADLTALLIDHHVVTMSFLGADHLICPQGAVATITSYAHSTALCCPKETFQIQRSHGHHPQALPLELGEHVEIKKMLTAVHYCHARPAQLF